jgi:succinoglycan biosynthesis transport protein ExoP
MELDLRQLLRIGRQYLWIAVILMLVAGGSAFFRSSQQSDLFRTTSQLIMLGESGENVNSYTAQLSSQNLIETYRSLIESDDILQRVVDELQLPYTYVELDQKVTTSAVADTLLLQVTVVDTDAQRAANIANAIAREFQRYIDDNIASDQNVNLSSPVGINNEARIPSEPFEPQPLTAALLGAFVGLLLAVALIAILEFLDNTVKPQLDFQELTGAPMLASIPQAPNVRSGSHQVYTVAQPRSAASEAIRLLRTNLEFASASADIRRFVVSSPNPGEGKSTTAANLGVALAQSGARTVLIDADLRRPTLHHIFGVPGDDGLTTLLTHPDRPWESVARRVAVANLMLVPSGPIPPNPSDLVSSQRFISLLDAIGQDADLIILDSPPILAASDALAMAAHVDGLVLVCYSNKTRLDQLAHAAQAIRQGGIRLIGVVLNRTKKQQGATYYGEYYSGSDVRQKEISAQTGTD